MRPPLVGGGMFLKKIEKATSLRGLEEGNARVRVCIRGVKGMLSLLSLGLEGASLEWFVATFRKITGETWFRMALSLLTSEIWLCSMLSRRLHIHDKVQLHKDKQWKSTLAKEEKVWLKTAVPLNHI